VEARAPTITENGARDKERQKKKKPNLLVRRRAADDEVGDRKEGRAGQTVPCLPA
jgi:hypothetical protein